MAQLAQLTQNCKNHQIESAPNLIFFSLRKIKSMSKKLFFLTKKLKFVFTLFIFLTEFLICRTKQRFLSMFIIILSLEKKVEKTQIKYYRVQNSINSYYIWDLRFLGFRFFRCLMRYCWKITLNIFLILITLGRTLSVSFSALVPPEPDFVHQYFLAARMSPKFPLPLVPCRVFQPIVCIFPSITD